MLWCAPPGSFTMQRREQAAWSIRAMFERGLELKRLYGADSVADLSLGNPLAEPPAEVRARLRELVGLENFGVDR